MKSCVCVCVDCRAAPGEQVKQTRVLRDDREVLGGLPLVVLQLGLRAVLHEKLDELRTAASAREHQWRPAAQPQRRALAQPKSTLLLRQRLLYIANCKPAVTVESVGISAATQEFGGRVGEAELRHEVQRREAVAVALV